MLKYDFTGVEQFFKVVNLLQKDNNPSEEIWDELFANPGYAKLIQAEFSREIFQELFKIAYMPSKNQKREEILNGDNEVIKNILLHYNNVLKSEDKINIFLNEYKSQINEKRILKYTLEYLPAN